MPTTKEWIEQKTNGHTFGSGKNYGNINNNVVFTLRDPVELVGPSGRRMLIPAGAEVCIYRQWVEHGNERIAAMFFDHQQVVVTAGGYLHQQDCRRTGMISN